MTSNALYNLSVCGMSFSEVATPDSAPNLRLDELVNSCGGTSISRPLIYDKVCVNVNMHQPVHASHSTGKAFSERTADALRCRQNIRVKHVIDEAVNACRMPPVGMWVDIHH